MAEATHALRQMGPEVFPHLRSMLAPDSAPVRLLNRWRQASGIAGTHAIMQGVSPEETRMLLAVEACTALGTDAQPMVPDLIRTLQNNAYRSVRTRAAYALGQIGAAASEVVPALVESLESRPDANVLIALGNYGAEARSAVPVIQETLQNLQAAIDQGPGIDVSVAFEAVQALHRIDPPEAPKAVPLLQVLRDLEGNPAWHSRLTQLLRDLEAHPESTNNR